jgi:hypothetical protein
MDRQQNIETQETQPLPIIPPLRTRKPSLTELRLSCRMSRDQLSQAAGVRLCRVDWMERGVETSLSDALKVLLVLSRSAHYWYRIEDIRGLRIKAPPAMTQHP